MIRYFIAIFIMLVFVGCAVSYSPISKLESIGDVSFSNEEIFATIGIQPLGNNTRNIDYAVENGIKILHLTVDNKSNAEIAFLYDSVFITKNVTSKYTISPDSAAKKLSLTEWSYWLYSLIWMGRTDCVNGDCSSSWYPVGIPIALLNYIRAHGGNSNLQEDLRNNSFKSTIVPIASSAKGFLFFQDKSTGRCKINIPYWKYNEKKMLSIEYKL